jgi:hypothetical protein
MEGIMRAQKSILIALICLFLGFIATISLTQQAPGEFPPEEAGAEANLAVSSVSGPAKAFLNQTISVTYNYCAVVAISKQASIVRYSLTDGNDTVTDHKTDLI